jgi:hypothetical protein
MSTFQILVCGNNENYYVESGEETLSIGQTWGFSGISGEIICGTIVQPYPLGIPNFTATTLYDGCGSCLSENTIYVTANTIEDICLILCDDPISGGTIATQVDAPHPIWIGLYGEQITQGNAVTIGGTNGINS